MNTNPQAVRAANERFRVVADKLAQAYHLTRITQAQIAAEGIDTLFTDDKSVIADGSDVDGRSPLTNDDVKQLIGVLGRVVDFFDGDPTMRDLVLRVAPNPERF